MSASPPISTEQPPSACSRCGQAFTCGYVSGQGDCWCGALPRLPAEHIITGPASCLCPACLRNAMEAAGLPIGSSGD